jgi:hypothetical protein
MTVSVGQTVYVEVLLRIDTTLIWIVLLIVVEGCGLCGVDETVVEEKWRRKGRAGGL